MKQALCHHLQGDVAMSKNAKYVDSWRIRTKRKLVLMYGGKCVRCGYNKDYPGAYHFHHREPNTKEFELSSISHGFDACLEEAKKCDLLCANCHSEVHADERKRAGTVTDLRAKQR